MKSKRMKSKTIKICIIILLSALTLSLTGCTSRSLTTRVTQLEEENEELQAAIKILSSRIQKLEDR